MAEIILEHRLLSEKIEALKSQRKKVVLANGCFDLLRVGHVRYLRGAKALGDVLVLALNSDESVRRLKGVGRPLLPLPDRLGILSAFEMVDFVTVCEDDRLEPLLLELKPTLYAKGGEDAVDVTASFGGKVQTVETKGPYAQDLIEEILRKYGPLPANP